MASRGYIQRVCVAWAYAMLLACCQLSLQPNLTTRRPMTIPQALCCSPARKECIADPSAVRPQHCVWQHPGRAQNGAPRNSNSQTQQRAFQHTLHWFSNGAPVLRAHRDTHWTGPACRLGKLRSRDNAVASSCACADCSLSPPGTLRVVCHRSRCVVGTPTPSQCVHKSHHHAQHQQAQPNAGASGGAPTGHDRV
jgi:hypothetical protein